MRYIFKTVALCSLLLFTACESGTGENQSLEDVLGSDKPKIKLEGNETIEITLGTNTISEAGFSAFDEEDKDLTESVKRENDIDFTKIGNYRITYSVEDTDGYKDVKYRYVNIINPLGSSNSDVPPDPFYNNGQAYQGSVPKIQLLKDEKPFTGPLYLPLGTEYDIAFAATDFEDGNLGHIVDIKGANFDINKAGTYLVTYSVTDSNENTVSTSLTVIVGNSSTWTDTTTSTFTTLDNFILWYESECGKTFNRGLYNETTGRYSGTISCASQGLTYIDLEQISIFSSIESLDLSGNNLDDIDFTPLQNTHVIKKIDLSNNNFSTIDFSPLYNLYNINELWLNGNQLNYTRAERVELYKGFNNQSFTIYF